MGFVALNPSYGLAWPRNPGYDAERQKGFS